MVRWGPAGLARFHLRGNFHRIGVVRLRGPGRAGPRRRPGHRRRSPHPASGQHRSDHQDRRPAAGSGGPTRLGPARLGPAAAMAPVRPLCKRPHRAARHRMRRSPALGPARLPPLWRPAPATAAPRPVPAELLLPSGAAAKCVGTGIGVGGDRQESIVPRLRPEPPFCHSLLDQGSTSRPVASAARVHRGGDGGRTGLARFRSAAAVELRKQGRGHFRVPLPASRQCRSRGRRGRPAPDRPKGSGTEFIAPHGPTAKNEGPYHRKLPGANDLRSLGALGRAK